MHTGREGLPVDAVAALKRGRKIEAIKLTRAATGMGLKEAKQAVEAAIENDPAVREAYRAANPTTSNLPLLGFVIVVTLLMYWLVFRD